MIPSSIRSISGVHRELGLGAGGASRRMETVSQGNHATRYQALPTSSSRHAEPHTGGQATEHYKQNGENNTGFDNLNDGSCDADETSMQVASSQCRRLTHATPCSAVRASI